MTGPLRPDVSNTHVARLQNLQEKIRKADVSDAPAILQELSKANVDESIFNVIPAIIGDGTPSSPQQADDSKGSDVSSALVSVAHTLKALVEQGTERLVETAKSLKDYVLNLGQSEPEDAGAAEAKANNEPEKNEAEGRAESRKNEAQGRAEEAKNSRGGKHKEEDGEVRAEHGQAHGKGRGRRKGHHHRKGHIPPGLRKHALDGTGPFSKEKANPMFAAILEAIKAEQPPVAPESPKPVEAPQPQPVVEAPLAQDISSGLQPIPEPLPSIPPAPLPVVSEPVSNVVSEPVDGKPAPQPDPPVAEPAPVAVSEPSVGKIDPVVDSILLNATNGLDLSNSDSVNNFLNALGSSLGVDSSVVQFATGATIDQIQNTSPQV